MARGSVARWAGGYVRKGVYIIRRTVKGRPFEVSTRCTREAAALQQLTRFEADPHHYTPAPAAAVPLYLERELVKEFLTWSRQEKGNSAHWVKKQQMCLGWWADEIAGRNLRTLTLQELKAKLRGVDGWKHRAAVLKAFYTWLRQEKMAISLAEDPVHGQLRVPASRPEQWTRPKVIPRQDLVKVLRELLGPFRDAVEVLAGTGWHLSELLRFMAAGDVERDRVLVCPQTKGGSPVKRIVTVRVAAAAKRLRAHDHSLEPVTEWTLRAALEEACGRAKIGRVLPGRFRHTFATWAIEHGASPEAVAAALDHKSKATSQRFYATLAVRPKVPAPR